MRESNLCKKRENMSQKGKEESLWNEGESKRKPNRVWAPMAQNDQRKHMTFKVYIRLCSIETFKTVQVWPKEKTILSMEGNTRLTLWPLEFNKKMDSDNQ